MLYTNKLNLPLSTNANPWLIFVSNLRIFTQSNLHKSNPESCHLFNAMPDIMADILSDVMSDIMTDIIPNKMSYFVSIIKSDVFHISIDRNQKGSKVIS